ncbi:(deoxy)nucleoside triphosphate pyrophosphohydrolase [Nocardioides acrostichi]|uniref:8-oxo-dGTP diphosphatase n=1 Tax=Nocardioides acrostichi TaxID=2784339 RepID=A0A930Y7U0_9ACTN|nr:(deoxy)nucleoside triphosphate pyrophosphohydrolase [Nocardioides acrostichi]MBF4162397.1 (deoxy)nucleoside triphosphate pyrophosphohydrolase [Nocardioides acrostichi]
MGTTVVGAAIVRGGRVLAARRTDPPNTAGRWELPGGKVEPGETASGAIVRELAEELGVEVEVTGWLATRGSIERADDGAWVLRIATVRLVGDAEPQPAEHDALVWLGSDELDSVDWLDSDRVFLPELDHLLRGLGGAFRRLVLFEADDAREVVRRLRVDGYDAAIARERLAGEDDDEDHPWAVLTDAPSFLAEMLADEFDGWLDERLDDGRSERGAPGTPAAPQPLPSAPKRIKRPDGDPS